jgi:hypothetical protein
MRVGHRRMAGQERIEVAIGGLVGCKPFRGNPLDLGAASPTTPPDGQMLSPDVFNRWLADAWKLK